MNPSNFFKQRESARDYNIEFDLSSPGKLKELKGREKVGFREYIGNDYLSLAKKNYRRANPIAANQADIVYWVLYDRFYQAAGTGTQLPSKFVFFAVPQLQNVTTAGTTYTKAKQDTNLVVPFQLEAPQWMNVIGEGIYFSSNMVKADIDGILNTSYMEDWVTAKIYAEGPLQIFPSGAGLSGVTDQTSQASWSNGWPVSTNIFDLRLPAGIHLGMGTDDSGNPVAITTDGLMGITILQSQTFHVDIKSDTTSGTSYTNAGTTPYTLLASNATPTAGTGCNMMCYKYGILSRGVQ